PHDPSRDCVAPPKTGSTEKDDPEIDAELESSVENLRQADPGAARSLYQPTKLVGEQVLNDPGVRASIGGLGNEGAMRELNRYVDDAACEFRELRGMFQLFPDEEMWVKEGITRLRAMWVKHLREEEKKKREKAGPIRTRRTVKLAEFDALKRKHEAAMNRIDELEAEVAQLRKHL